MAIEVDRPSILQQIRESPVAIALDTVIEGLDHFLGASGKAYLANGLDEVRQVFTFGTEQIQAGQNPGLWGTITTGEATAERMGELSLDELRSFAQVHGKSFEHENGHERGGREME